MEFPSKPWADQLDIPIPTWATYNIDFVDHEGESFSVWISGDTYQYWRETNEGAAITDNSMDSGGWKLPNWEHALTGYPYVKITDLQTIVENE